MYSQLLCALGSEPLSKCTLVRSVSGADAVGESVHASVDEDELLSPPPPYEVRDGGMNESWLVAPMPAAGLSLATTFSSLVNYSILDRKVKLLDKPATCSKTITSTRFKEVALLTLQNIFMLLRVAKWKVDFVKSQHFDRTKQLPYAANVDLQQGVDALRAVIDETFGSDQDWAEEGKTHAKAILDDIVRAEDNAKDIVDALRRANELHRNTLVRMGAVNFATVELGSGGGEDHHTFTLSASDDEFTVSWPAQFGENLFAAAMNIAQALREADQEPGFNDFVAFHVAYRSIMESNLLIEAKVATRFLGTVGFRPHSQTYVSLTDPGEGHIFGTTRHSRWMTGAIVHNEHLERPKGVPRSEIESYRIPEIVDFACVRLHVGAQAPTTAYIGRFLHTSAHRDFEHEFVSTVNVVKAALNKFFDLGAAECKISMDGLTTSQMVRYMRALATVPRDRLQYLSAAFNINPATESVTDDSVEGQPAVQISGGADICRRGIQLAAQGGFDKVTFDGASDKYPSVPFIQQLGFADALGAVHEAHSVGLATYMSAGFTFKNIKDAVYTGVDGIGLGGAQILRYMDKATGMHGPYTEENIDRIKVEREDAEKSLRGRGALLLARLDHMHFEGSLTAQEAALRAPLYRALADRDVAEIQRVMSEEPAAGDVVSVCDDGEQPYVGRARRILRTDEPLLRKGAEGDDARWGQFVQMLRKYADRKDEGALQEKYGDKTWIGMRAAYRKAIGDDKCDGKEKYFQGEPHYSVKV